MLFSYEVGLVLFLLVFLVEVIGRCETIGRIFFAGFVLLIVAAAVGVMKSDVEREFLNESLCQMQLSMLLGVVVILVWVVCSVAFVVFVFACRVVARILLHLGFRHSVPRHIGLLLAAEHVEAYFGARSEVAYGAVVGIQV